MKRIGIFFLAAFFCCAQQSCSEQQLGALRDVLDATETATGTNTSAIPLTQEEVIQGLKDALRMGTDSSVALLSAVNGFNGNPLVRIPFPEDAMKVKEKAIELGFEQQVNTFENTLNLAAEEASKEAAQVFWGAIQDMTISDGFAILNGGNDAATNYLKQKTTAELTQRFSPKVQNAIDKVQLTKYWEPLVTKYNTAMLFTGGEEINTDLNAYVTDQAIDGLFFYIQKEEANIRQDPKARVTSILEKVFGN